jgi:probable rRNA maturation factor
MKVLIRNQQRRRPLDRSRILNAANNILSLTDRTEAELSILFTGDKKMLELNNTYRGKNRTTDVLSFESRIPVYIKDGPDILGDIVICIPRAEAQAKSAGVEFYDELFRLLIHGVLHLTGYDHEASLYMARKMQKKEEEIFNALKTMD